MKREVFEEMVQKALNGLAASPVEGKRKSRKAGIGGVRYGKAEKLVGQAVSRLAAISRSNKPIAIPSPDIVPPCF
ncbi:hypothetical protein [Sulfuricystis multivorans]|uniref:hypothetical protein n=1 Tax=Sulfuricystis multivorans TaxID=2211108 RepID=UPI000F82B312|nr:hypothetical protein [Sulfuricystis multivorans]